MGDVPQGRAYAFQLPENLRSEKSAIVNVGGQAWVLEFSTGLLCPLEAVCEKVRIPGVRYPEEGT